MTQNTTRLIADLDSPKEKVRGEASYALGSLPPGVPLDIFPLILATQSTAERTRFWALTALGRIYQRFEEIVPEVAKCLSDPSFGNRQAAARCLGKYAEFAGQFLDDIAQLLSDTNEFVRAEAVRAISRFPQTSEHVIAQVVASLDDDSSGVRSAGAIAVKLLGPLAEPRKEELADRIRQAPQSVEAIHLEAALSFMDFCKQATSDALVREFASDDWFGRERAIRCASHMVDPPIELLEGLDALLDRADFEIQLAAAEAIRRQAMRAAHLKRRLRTRLASKQWAGNGPESMGATTLNRCSRIDGQYETTVALTS